MNETRPLYLQEFRPNSKLRVQSHDIRKPRFPAIDAHGHFAGLYCPLYTGGGSWTAPDIPRLVDGFRTMGIERMVNLDGFWDGFLGLTLEHVFSTLRPFEDFFVNFVSIDTRRATDPDFEDGVRAHLHRARDLGARGVKIFKHLSLMTERRPYEFVPGRGLLPDDPRLSVIWDTAADLGFPVLIHIADPPAFFDPVDEHNERYGELLSHPDWAYYGSGAYGFDELMAAQCRLLAAHPRTTFIVAHVGSHAEDLAFVSHCLDRYPNMLVDIAARIDVLGRQPYTSRAFFEHYSRRILFGTDAFPEGMDRRYPAYYRFLETKDEQITGEGLWPMIGIGLRDKVLHDLYRGNACRVLGFSQRT